MQVTSTRLPYPVSMIVSNVFIESNPDENVVLAISKMLKLDQWYSPVVDNQRRYLGVLGLENVISYILDKDANALEKSVEQFMTRDVIVVSYKQSTYSAWQLMLSQNIAALPVVNDKGVLVGVVAEYDLLRYGYSRPKLESDNWLAKSPPIREVMSTPPVTVAPNDTLRTAAELMITRNIGRVYVVNEYRKLLGVVDREDIVRAYFSIRGLPLR
ncbi:MAG: CBS domain-containing protein [Pyrodictiaceae archaeon]